MKKFLLLSFLTVLLFNTGKTQALYLNNTPLGSYYNPGLNSRANQRAVFDDVNIPSAQIGGSDSFYITRVKFGIARAANAPATTVRFYYSPVNDTATSTGRLLTVPPSYRFYNFACNRVHRRNFDSEPRRLNQSLYKS